MANWPPPPPSAPPHGLPFHPGYPAQNGQSTPSNGASYQNLPHFPPQTSQPTPNALAFQQNASFPPVNLADIDPAHVAAVVQQMVSGRGGFPLPPLPPQSGFPPPPPPPLPFGFPPPANLPIPIPPQQMQTPLASANHHPLPNAPVPNNRVMEIANGDKEEGELSDEPEPSGRVADSRHSTSAQHGRMRDDRSAAGGDFYRPGKDGVATTGSDSHWTRNNRSVEHVQTDMEHDAGFDRYSSSARPRSPRTSAYGDTYSSMKSRGDDSRRQSRTDQWRRASDQHDYASKQHRNATEPRPDEQPRQAPQNKAASGVQSSGTDSVPAQNNKEQAEHFLRVLNACGFSLNDVKTYSALDIQILEDVWRSLGLPVDEAESAKPQAGLPQPPPKQIDTSSRAANVSLPAKPPAKAPETKSAAALPAALPRPVVPPAQGSQKPEEKTTVGTSVSSRNSTASVASPPADRAAYIARLMAAKKNSSASANKTATPAATPAPATESRTAAAVPTQQAPSQISSAKVASSPTTTGQSMPSQTTSLPPTASPAAQSQPVVAQTTQTSTSQIAPNYAAQSAASSHHATSGAPTFMPQQPVEQKEAPAVDPAVLAAQKKQAQNDLVRKRIEQLKLQRQKTDAEEAARAKAQAAVASANSQLRGGSVATGAALSQQMRASANLPARPAPLQTATPTAMPTAMTKTPVQDAQAPPGAASPAGGIPGLMLTAPSVSQPFVPASNTPVSAGTSARGRKRPVAADFDDVKPATPSAFKRPFGQSRFETGTEMMIIEVSDDEGSIEDTNEADYQLQQSSRVPTQPQPDLSKQNATSGQYTPTAVDLPPRPGFGRLNSAQPTPPASQTPGSVAHADSLRRKEEEIALLKRKLEERQRNLKSKSQPSRTGTPVNSGPVTQVSTPVQVDSPVTAPASANGAAPSTMSPLTRALADPPLAVVERERSGSLLVDRSSANASPAASDWKTRRRAEIESGLTAYDADLSKNMSRLEQLRREMEQLEEENRRRQKEKNDLANELESLGIDTEGMAHEELQAKKDEIMLQREEENREAVAAVAQEVQEMETFPAESLDARGEKSEATPVENMVEETSNADSLAIVGQPQVPEEELVQDDKGHPDSRAPSDMEMSEGESEDEHENTDAEMDMSDSEVDEGSAAQEPRESTESGEVSENQPLEPPTEIRQLEEGEDSEDFYSPEPVPRISTPEAADEAMDIASNSSSDESSDEDEEEYTPPDTAPAGKEHTPQETTHAEPGQDQVLPNGDDASSEAMDEGEDDDYEPSDALPATAQAPASSPSEASESKLEVEHPSSRILSLSASKSGSEAPSQTPEVTIIADDVAPELQSRSAEQTRDSAKAASASDIKKQAFFTPYDSPLRMFKAYRYHPDYTDTVSGGFKSLTYSHDIDPMKPICPFEAAGGICNDPECDGQHFRGMGISEDKILLQLGIVNPGRTQEDQDLWRAGLRQILKNLREQGVKSGEAVAKAIADYRREFLQDPTRVLNL